MSEGLGEAPPAPEWVYKFCPKCGEVLQQKQLKQGEPERLVCPSCGFIFYLDPKIAACTIEMVDGGIVLVKRAIEPALGKWVVPGGFVDRAQLLAGEGELSAALVLLVSLLEREPDSLPARLLEGGVLLQLREEEQALASFERAVALAPDSVEARNGLARCLHAIGRNDEALQQALAARERLARPEGFAQTAAVDLTLVWSHREERRFKEALAAAERGLALCPDAVLAQWASV